MTINKNDRAYADMLWHILNRPTNQPDIKYEQINAHYEFNAHDRLSCVNEDYVNSEIEWYLSQDLNIKGHKNIETNKIWKNVATEDGHVNSNYGWCIFSKDNYEQFVHAVYVLKNDPYSKHAVLYYTRPSIVDEWNDDEHASWDMICTIYVMYIIRNNKLDALVHMRSNDAWRGFRNDLTWQQYVLHKLADTLDVEEGKIYWNADSLHIYERDVDKVNKYMEDYRV